MILRYGCKNGRWRFYMFSVIIINLIIGKLSRYCSFVVRSFSLVFSLLRLNHSEIELSKSSFFPNRHGEWFTRSLIRGTDYFSQFYLAVCRISGQWFNCIDTGRERERGWGEKERENGGRNRRYEGKRKVDARMDGERLDGRIDHRENKRE